MSANLTFGRFELLPASRQLLADGRPVALGPRAFDVLRALIDHRERLVTKEELFDLVWPDLVVEENNLQVQVSSLRKILGADAIATVPGRGYQFTLASAHSGATPDAPKDNLPSPMTSFIGRERELHEAKELLSQARLLTLTGAGGIGKTRFALQLAAAVREAYPDGVWVVELASIGDSSLVPKSVAQVLEVREEAGTPLTRTLCKRLKGRRILLLLDNCEHLLQACAQLTDAILGAATEPTILATSREALRVNAEQVYPLPPLSLPDAAGDAEAIGRSEAVRLFVDRARRHRPGFALTTERAPSVAQLCIHLDGIPFALELAAARTRALSVEELSARIDDRFKLLTDGARGSSPRQQTLRATLDWSYELLDEVERTLFRRLGVFAGGWVIEAAEAICAGAPLVASEILLHLTALADKSLVMTDEHGGATRYRMLETVREYARERLVESADDRLVGASHLAYYLALAERSEPRLKSAEVRIWLERLEAEHDNLRAALTCARATNVPSGVALASALGGFWRIRGHMDEGRRWLSEFIAAAGDGRGLARAKALCELGALAERQGDYPTSKAALQESLALFRAQDDLTGASRALNALGALARSQGDYAAAAGLLQDSLRITRAHGDAWGTAAVLESLASVAYLEGDHQAAFPLYEESLAIRRQLGDQKGVAQGLNGLGAVAYARKDYARSQALFEESLAIRKELRDQHGIAQALHNLAQAMRYQGAHDRALELFQAALMTHRLLNERDSIAFCLESIANLATLLATPQAASRLWGAAERLRQEMGAPLPPADLPGHEQEIAAARAALADAAAFERAWLDGRAMPLEDAIQSALDVRPS